MASAVDVKSSANIDFSNENNEKDPKFEVAEHVRISKHKNIFAKCYVPNWSEEVFVIAEVKNTMLWTYIISDCNGRVNCLDVLQKRIAETISKRI